MSKYLLASLLGFVIATSSALAEVQSPIYTDDIGRAHFLGRGGYSSVRSVQMGEAYSGAVNEAVDKYSNAKSELEAQARQAKEDAQKAAEDAAKEGKQIAEAIEEVTEQLTEQTEKKSSGNFFTISPFLIRRPSPFPPAIPISASFASPGPLTTQPITAIFARFL